VKSQVHTCTDRYGWVHMNFFDEYQYVCMDRESEYRSILKERQLSSKQQ